MTSALPALPPPADAAIRIVGLGPGDLADLTLAAWQTLSTAPRLVVRTRQHPILDQLADRLDLTGCDDLYEQHAAFADVYAAIVDRVLTLAREPDGVVYAVPGHPWVGEATTRLILARAAAEGLTAQVVGGLSFVEPSLAAVGVDMLDGAQIVDAMLLATQHHPQIDTGLPLLIGQLYSRALASDVKLTLMNAYPPDHPVTVIQAAGTAQQAQQTRALHELDHADDFDHLTSLYAPPLAHSSFTALQEIIAHLRAPEGCPWDQEQTLESLRKDLLGEAVEVLEAIDVEAHGRDNGAHIAEELGDLYLVATMLVQIATEEGRFRLADVVAEVIAKLIRRHPHVFSTTEVDNVDQIVRNWDTIKAAEKVAKGQAAQGPLDGIPAHLPALEKAHKLQAKAAKAGLLNRAKLAQTTPALTLALGKQPDEAALGKLLWEVVARAHSHGLDAEDALRAYAVAFRQQHGG